MKKGAIICLISLGALALLICMPSCNTTDHTPPGIFFNNAQPYVYDDTTLPQGSIFSVAITASKAGVDQLLDTGFFSKSVNGGPDSVFQTMTLAESNFYQYYTYKVGDSGNTEKYTFSFGQTNGLKNSVSLTIKDSTGTFQIY